MIFRLYCNTEKKSLFNTKNPLPMGNEQQFSCYEFLYKFTKLKKKKNYLINIICYKINKRFFM